MKVIILGGFLGSGKTTLLLQLAPFLAQFSKKDPAVVILENEISVTDIDTKLLRSKDLTVKNLAAGCICCTESGALPISVEKIRQKYNPDYLIIEATGMAYPDSIEEILRNEGEKDITIVALADAKRWEKMMLAMPMFIHSQISQAQIVFLNKTDLVSPDKTLEVRTAIEEIAPEAVIHIVCAKDGIPQMMFEALKQEDI